MKILGIETSCDETAVAIVEEGHKIHVNLIASQSDLHALYGGVVPELASRRHIQLLLPMVDEALTKAQLSLHQLDAIAVTHTPGLLGALLVGVQTAKGLALACGLPLIGVHHLEAHLYSAWMSQSERSLESCLPALGVVISGGHTLAAKIERLGSYQLLAQSLDDGIGEAFDKVAVMLGLPYPGGPHIERLACQGDPKRYSFKAGRSKSYPHHFSYSGLKTQLLHAIWGHDLRAMQTAAPTLSESQKADLAASFQHSVIEDLVEKLRYWAQFSGARTLWIGGGVAANKTLRQRLNSALSLPLLWPTRELSLDNGAMIAGLAFHQPHRSPWSLPAVARTPLTNWPLS